LIDRGLLSRMLQGSPHQPATCLFRTIEVSHLLASGVVPATGRVLDVGCGDGFVTEVLASKLGSSWELIGVDPDPQEAELASRRPVYHRVLVRSASDTGEPAASYDIVLSNSALEHIPDIEATLREVARVLRPGGSFVFTVPSSSFSDWLGGPGLTGWAAEGTLDRAAYRRALDRRLVHLRYWSLEEWDRELARAGLRIAASSFYMSRASLRRWETLSNITGGIAARVMGRGARPIDVQRRLRLRRESWPLPVRALSYALCRVFAAGLSPGGALAEGAGLLVRATR
jgi:SAM-dependent methyltransferase